MAAARTFTRNVYGRSTYTCWVCSKVTRDTGFGEMSLELCKKCFIEAGLENHHQDNGGDHSPYGNVEEGFKCPLCVED